MFWNNRYEWNPFLFHFLIFYFPNIFQKALYPLFSNVAMLQKAKNVEIRNIKNGFFRFCAGFGPSYQDGQDIFLVDDS